MGGDTDTIGAIAGAVAGARHGAASIPDSWVTALRNPDARGLKALAESLVEREIAPVGEREAEEEPR